MASAHKSIPFVVPPQAVQPIKAILQGDLAYILELRRSISDLEERLEAAETAVRNQLEAGAPVEAGLFRALLKTSERRNVSWKAVVERELGEAYAIRVLAATKPDSVTRLVVEA